jgi:hypothetical protein
MNKKNLFKGWRLSQKKHAQSRHTFPVLIRPLLFFFIGFFLGNGGIIKGEFTQTLYEVTHFLTHKMFSEYGGGNPIQQFFFGISLKTNGSLGCVPNESPLPTIRDFGFFSLGGDELRSPGACEAHTFLDSTGYPDGGNPAPTNLKTDTFDPRSKMSFPNCFFNLEKLYFINLFLLFSLIESVNFAFFRNNNKGNEPKLSNFAAKNNSFDLLKKNAFLLNPLKLGLLFGLFVDAFKVGS